MKPLKLTIQAFGSYGRKAPPIDFEKPGQNLFLITGDTGAGKTTIFDAIVFALYGEASSGKNPKGGVEMQSQFVDLDIQPFVELVFSEQMGEETAVYTVRRVPRHMRPYKRGKGVKAESGRVSLLMPDGTEYPQKEADRKLAEIVGLTKEQFMQVAMIAQGEFMELLRADPEHKKAIFRKLFHTEMYQDIVEELADRRRKKSAEVEHISTVIRTEAGHIVVPEDHKEGETLRALKERVLSSGEISVTDIGSLLTELKKLCGKLEEGRQKAQDHYDSAGRCRDSRRDALTRARSLDQSFAQLAEAERDLAVCAAEGPQIQDMVRLIARIQAAYEIQTAYERFCDAESAAADTGRKQRQQQEALPELKEVYRKAVAAAEEAGRRREEDLKSFTKVSERVTKALGLLDKIQNARRDAARKEKELKAAEVKAQQAQQAFEASEQQEQEWRRQADRLEGAQRALALWEVKCREAEALAEDVASVKKARRGICAQEKKADQAKRDYVQARQAFSDKNAEYTAKNTAFLGAQAGFLARERLRPGKPCPVCGAKEHPHPCELPGEDRELTREVVDALSEEAARLGQEQQEKARAAGTASDLLAERKDNLAAMMGALRERMGKSIPDVPEELTPDQAERLLAAWRGSVQAEGDTVRKNADMLVQVQRSLKGIDRKRQSLRVASEQTVQAVMAARAALAGSQAALAGLEADREYPTKKAAEKALVDAEAAKKERDAAYASADRAAKAAKQRRDKAYALLERYSGELPGQMEECGRRRDAYAAVMAEKDLTELEWKDITEKHPKQEIASLQKTVDVHYRRKATAEGKRESALKAVGDQKRPDIEGLERVKNEAEEKLLAASAELERYRADHRADLSVYRALSPKMEERSRIMQEYTALCSLHKRLAGKMTGSRMDIETFVQRYYLQRILDAANIRFQEMSAGQFAFRMVSDEQAGEGKNRGLDLMVYSAVTGREREIRTLSGGESFMAALALALGMADQIQENSAAIHLDIMFIDEGFGSLDEHSREQAVRVLQQMAGGSRLIGIISHVTELKQMIEDQLLVSKDEEGSHVKWQIS